MFGFAYALVPLYEVFCELTGLNGRTSGRAADPAKADVRLVSSDREVTIQFLAHVGNGMPWEFRPTEHQLRVRLGEINATQYYARNRAAQAVTGQAVPSVSPGYAAKYLHKVECFCFTQQHLEAGEEQQMPVRFYLDADLPEEIHTLSLSYTLFKVPERVPERALPPKLASNRL
jgi:cytochrome c oxidase assembly protein subunit 11